jgi:hypothetical protein
LEPVFDANCHLIKAKWLISFMTMSWHTEPQKAGEKYNRSEQPVY